VGDLVGLETCIAFPSVISHCWLGDRKAVQLMCHVSPTVLPEEVEEEDQE